MPKDGTPEQVAAWRQQQGLPVKPEGYVEKLALPNGLVIGEAEKPLVGEFAKMAFERGMSPEAMSTAVEFWYGAQAAQEEARAEQDAATRVNAQAELIGEWGQGDYKANMNAVGGFVQMMPEGLRNNLLTARLPDGRMIGDTPEFNRWAAAQFREINPAAAVVPVGDANASKTITSELATIEAKMGDTRSDYWHGPTSGTQQARYRELLTAQEKMTARGRG